MGSIMGEEKHMKFSGSSLLMPSQKYKRRKVLGVREFPSGCGPNAQPLCMQSKVKEIQGVDGLNNGSCGEKREGLHEAERKRAVEPTAKDSGVVKLKASSLVTCGKVECKNVKSDKKPNTLEEIQIAAEKHIVTGETHDLSDELMEVRLQFPTTLKDSSVVDPKKLADVTDNSWGEEGTRVDHSLFPHYPISPTLVGKEQIYPPPRRVSAVRNFPVGSSCNIYVKSNYTHAKHLEADKGVTREINMQAPMLNNNDEQRMQDIALSVYGEKHESNLMKDTDMNEKSVCVSSNIKLQGESIGDFVFEKGVIVQGLMCEASSPWNQIKGPAKLSLFCVSKKSKGKNLDYDAQEPCLIKCEDNAESMLIVPCVKDMEADEVSRPLGFKDNQESSENVEHNDLQLLPDPHNCDSSSPFSVAGSSNERVARSNVRETLKLFQALVRKLLQGQETKSKDKGKASKRIDLAAAGLLKEKGKYINTQKVIGEVPGVEVGDFFSYRIELAIIGIHGPLQSGIDTKREGKNYLAISVVASGGYDNDVDNSDVLIYTGQGGNPVGADKHPEDQKLERGNLALKNCIDAKNPVRVVRGFKEAKPGDNGPKMLATYTYDGLYTVERYWQDLGHHKNVVYKFELKRIPGQRQLVWKEMKQFKKCKVREGCCVDDISKGKDKPPICAINTVDDETPPPFTYITSMMYPDWCRPLPRTGCNCKDGCSDSDHCSCAVKNGGEIPYNLSGAIVLAKPLVYECGSTCSCPPSCPNRVSQHGIKLPLEIFKTKSRGWGVRCHSSISSGSFICEYIGELLEDKQAEQRAGSDEYLFDIGQNYDDTTFKDKLSDLMPNMPSISSDVVENGFTIDARSYGNIGRFINHSCSPNLYAQNVLYDHDDKRIPHIMLFASDNIPPLQELTYHYNYTIDQVFDSNGNIKKKDCYCGAADCSGRMY
ncbi:histone-lysine N-methyltransferase, H3 lysine-9 specific SUVH6-like [Silene latifolia]|uniref:histone-lysine N-methyltransferase, H3 lysine-9 specific SUVH6-like n=1 Tax=Silene latifolia TaxID=37657 RepID=UPI003D774596